MSKKLYNSHGKLLLFGEYAVIDGAKAVAIPCKKGQSLEIKPHRGSDLIWECYDQDGELWFESQISLYDFSAVRTSDEGTSKFMQKLLKGAVRYNTEFLNKWNGFKAINKIDFPITWGLGSSSTLINNVANWAQINPFHLHFKVSSGSGYDIACAEADGPITYQLREDELNYQEIDFDPRFMSQVYFVYLGNKQSSESAIYHYSKNVKRRKALAKEVTVLTEKALSDKTLKEFMNTMDAHEKLLGKELKMDCVKDVRFSDFEGSIKSLGAWGGDFVMVASKMSESETKTYFVDKGYEVFIPYHTMVHNTDISVPA